MQCQCPHEDCGTLFEHNGSPNEPTCCPKCGRQQMPHKASIDADLTDVILNAIGSCPQNVREGFFQILRERWCIYCGSEMPTYQCFCRS